MQQELLPDGETLGTVRTGRVQGEVEGGADVVVEEREAIQRLRVPSRPEQVGEALHGRATPPQVPQPHVLELARCGELLERVVADRLEQ